MCSAIAASVRDRFAEGVDIVVGMRRDDDRPLQIIELRCFRASYILANEPPVEIEV